jgi:hypothetical protein
MLNRLTCDAEHLDAGWAPIPACQRLYSVGDLLGTVGVHVGPARRVLVAVADAFDFADGEVLATPRLSANLVDRAGRDQVVFAQLLAGTVVDVGAGRARLDGRMDVGAAVTVVSGDWNELVAFSSASDTELVPLLAG